MKIFVNFKTYPQGTGEKAAALAKICQEVSEEKKVVIIPVVQAVDLYRVTRSVNIPVWIQHLDWHPQGQYTGFTNLEAVIEAGASGALLNHSEHQIPPGTVKQVISRSSKFPPNRRVQSSKFEVMVCCKTLGQMKRLVKLKPDFIAYEIAELIGTKNSITQVAPKAIKHAVEICNQIPLIVGAGIHTKKDLETAQKLGAKGVLISSAVVLAQNPKKKLLELIANCK